MNNKVLVKLIVPYLDETYELFVPVGKRVSTVIKLIEKALIELTNGYYPVKDNSTLIDGDSGSVFDVNITIKEAKIQNGTCLIML